MQKSWGRRERVRVGLCGWGRDSKEGRAGEQEWQEGQRADPEGPRASGLVGFVLFFIPEGGL